ncbi:SDR family oxidoreductase [Pseudomonas yamanorum]|uniref:SDR family oxidoreductase n=1 Tax=Pseudomonas yamanorum TaxID=515393 RepID=A0A7Y8K700_9PSED|nr:SDR family oxidoreductase [Pseudomonas yamanorum]NWE77799.1 SDR family oxidoreductase [Pseudomonas yamanorum]
MRKNILITGASSGLGAGMAREFAKRGCNLALCARRLDRLEELKVELLQSAPGIKVFIRELDVTNYDQVFQVFRAFGQDMKSIDRVIVNAGIGTGAPIGKGKFEENKRTIETNFIAALAQSEAAMETFRAQEKGHLVIMSSMSAMRGLRGTMTAYSSSKVAVAAMAEGIRADVLRKRKIKVTTLYPGYIRTELNEKIDAGKTPFIVDAAKGCHLLVAAIEQEPTTAYVPWWPWAIVGYLMRRLPLSWVVRLS